VTVFANHLAFKVTALQQITGNRVVELDGTKRGNMCVPSFVFGVTLSAFLFFLHQTMVAPLQSHILQDFRVAVFTESGLSILVEGFMAILAIRFIFAMALNHITRHG
jgi:small basic protein